MTVNEKRDMQTIMDNAFSSLRFQAASRRSAMDRALGKEGTVMKRKMSVGLALALVLMLFTASALAAIAIIRSDEANKVNLSREALYQKYGLTPKTLGLFIHEGGEKDGEYVLTWKMTTFSPSLTGEYKTVLKDGKVTASWTHDDTDSAVYASGDLSAPVWGPKQLEAAFADRAKADAYSLAHESKGDAEFADAARPELKAGERFWNGEILREAEPDGNAISSEKAFAIAVQALSEDFGIPAEVITASPVFDICFLTRANGGTVWDIGFYVIYDGAEYDMAVRLDGASGEVLTIDALTGGNG